MLSHDSSRHRKFYRANPSSWWLYAYLLICLWQPLYLTYSSEWSALTSDLLIRKAQHLHLTYSPERHALTSHLVGTNPTITSERPNTHIHHHDRTQLISSMKRLNTYIWPTHQKGTTLTSDLLVRKACTQIWSCRNQSYTHIRMAPSPRLSYLVTDQVPPFSQRMLVALTSDLLIRMASTHIWHGRNLIL